MSSETAIQSFYRDSHVLITGATGFLGKVLIEKLLRSCPHVSKLYLLIRCKKGKTPEARLLEIFDDPLFERLSSECPNFMDKIQMLPGDCSLPKLGLYQEHVELVQDKVSVVFHGAATVRFDENLKIAYGINVGGVKEMLSLSLQMKNLKAVVHISTAFSNCNRDFIEEKFYDPPSCTPRVEELAAILTNEEIEKITPELLENWPNTYTMTKAIAEHYVRQEEGKLPICVFRPSIVISTCKEPIPGWIDNVYGPTGMAIGGAIGILRVIWADRESDANLVPVDLAVNGVIAAAKETHELFISSRTPEIKIYNFESGSEKTLKWKDYQRHLADNFCKLPTIQSIWYFSRTMTKSYNYYLFLSFFLHFLPACIIDGLTILMGKRPRMIKMQQKISKFTMALSYFALRTYKFDGSNVKELIKKTSEEDKKLFDSNVKNLDWSEYFYHYVVGARAYILKESLDTVPQALVRWKRLYWLDIVTTYAFYYVIAHFSYMMLYKLI